MRVVTVFVMILATLLSLVFALPASADSLRWGQCPDTGVPTPGLECTTLTVPLDYRNPHGTTIQLAVSRLPSTNPARRRGVMLLNPGGPGGPGLNLPTLLAGAGLSPAIRERYDLIGFDPRGVEYSTPVTCALPPELQTTNVPPYARSLAEVRQRAVVARDIAGRCAASPTSAILPYINTANTARDMDRIRIALGERKISYLGYSYGTYLGAVYATLFGHRTDRIVLDSVLSPGGLDVAASRRLALGFQDRFPDFAEFAAARHDTYGLGRTPREVTATYFELAARLDREPVLGVDGILFRVFTFSQLYFTVNFPGLAEVWQTLRTSSAPTAPTVLAVPDVENILASQLYVTCNDNDWPESVRTYQRNVTVDRIRHPMFGAAAANIWPCAFWAPEPIEPPVRIDDRGPSDILLVQNLRDQATPLAGAREMRAALGGRARMVTVDQGGHGVFLFGANACANDAVNRFFVDGVRPARDSLCAKENTATVGQSADLSLLRSALRPPLH